MVTSSGSGISGALKNNGTIWTWGKNTFGTLANGTTTGVMVPTQVGTASNWSSIMMYNSKLIVKNNTGQIYGAGTSTYSELGNNAIQLTNPDLVLINVPCALGVVENELTNTTIKAYPNPTNGKVTLDFKDATISPFDYTITNYLGQHLTAGKIEANKVIIDLGAYATGLYFITLKDKNITNTIKIIKINT